jgi:type II restriction enzyme
MSQLTSTNSTLDYFTDFEKVRKNVNAISIKLNQLNYLLGKEDLYEAVLELFEENPKAFDVLEILIAVRKNKGALVLNHENKTVRLKSYFSSPELIIEYLNETGLANVFKDKDITNLVDYVFGIEVGLDTNARKNRGGTIMTNVISHLFNISGIKYSKEISSNCFEEITSLGEDIKHFDFVIRTKRKIYLIEVNYYNTGGSKLNETARAYSDIAPKINQYSFFEFVWITDGLGWQSARNKLEEAYSTIPSLYNLTTIQDFIEKLLSEEVIEL